jgi:hypothetical protein
MTESRPGFTLTRTLLIVMVVALGACAATGIAILVFGEFGETEGRILGMCGAIAYASLTGLGCAVALERDVLKLLATIGIAVSVVTGLALTAGIWTDLFESTEYAKTCVILSMLAAATAHTTLLSLARLRSGYAWSRFVTAAATFLLVSVLSGMLLFEEDDEALVRFAGVLSILVALGTLAVPILHRLSGIPPDKPHEAACPEEIELICPRCHRRQRVLLGEGHCQHCELSINVEIRGWDDVSAAS